MPAMRPPLVQLRLSSTLCAEAAAAPSTSAERSLSECSSLLLMFAIIIRGNVPLGQQKPQSAQCNGRQFALATGGAQSECRK